MSQPTLGYARHTDPAPSHDAARTCNAATQRQTILDDAAALSYVTADHLHQRHPQVQRNVWSTRLSAMERAGLIEKFGYVAGLYGRKVSAYRTVTR